MENVVVRKFVIILFCPYFAGYIRRRWNKGNDPNIS